MSRCIRVSGAVLCIRVVSCVFILLRFLAQLTFVRVATLGAHLELIAGVRPAPLCESADWLQDKMPQTSLEVYSQADGGFPVNDLFVQLLYETPKLYEEFTIC